MKVDYNILEIANNNADKIEQQMLREIKEERELDIQQRLIARTILAVIMLAASLLIVDFVFWLTSLL